MNEQTLEVLEKAYKECNGVTNRRALSRLTGISERKCRTFLDKKPKGVPVNTKEKKKNEITEQHYVNALVHLSRHDINRLNLLTESDFRSKTNAHTAVFDYNNIHSLAVTEIENCGYCFPETITLPADSKVLVVGDSHGTRTSTKMFNLIKNLYDRERFDYIVHIGHIADDDNIISYWWWRLFNNLIIIAKPEELALITKTVKDNNATCHIIRECVNVGEYTIRNQELITDYTKTYIGNLDQQIFSGATITNLHRHEIASRCSVNYNVPVASPGCLCEKHIVKTIKQIDYLDGMQVKLSKPDSYIKYRRAKQMYELWENGFIALDKGTLIPCRIKQNILGDFETAYINKIYTESDYKTPLRKIFINGDIHCDSHDSSALAIQEQFVQNYQPDVYINLGDTQDNKAFNHHELAQGAPREKSLLDEQAKYTKLLERMSTWAKTKYTLFGNHELFLTRFNLKFPALTEMFSLLFKYPADKYGYNIVGHKEVLNINGVSFVHGDMLCFGQAGGSSQEKLAKTMGTETVAGHSHATLIRYGCYSVGTSGKLDQQYNEANASRWTTGFAIANISYTGLSFVSNIAYDSKKNLTLGGKTYYTSNEEFIKCKGYEAIIDFKYKD